MPQVGMKKYSYGPKGMAAAKKDAEKTGKKIVMKPMAMKKMGPKK